MLPCSLCGPTAVLPAFTGFPESRASNGLPPGGSASLTGSLHLLHLVKSF